MTGLLREVVQIGTGRKAQALGRPSGGKTGTTSDYKDAWYVGFTPEIVTGVWIGYDDPALSLGHGETGSEAALPIWLEFMKEATSQYEVSDFSLPPGVVTVNIDPEKGRLRAPNDPAGRSIAFIAGTEPTSSAPGRDKSVDAESELLKESF
jgi:penicillin-binding protein 1A